MNCSTVIPRLVVQRPNCECRESGVVKTNFQMQSGVMVKIIEDDGNAFVGVDVEKGAETSFIWQLRHV